MQAARLTAQAGEAGAVVTVEEHQVNGGLGGAIAELLAKKCPAPMEFVAVQDKFGQTGTPAELLEHHGLGVSHIVAAVRTALKRRAK